MGVATIFSFVFGYLIIMSLNVGLAYEISRKRQRPEDIGIFYQRALLINLLFSACVITPALYLSRRLMWGVPTAQERAVGEYLYQLVPSIYCFAFYDTTQTYLQAQGHILAPLVIQVVAVFMHLLLIKKLGAAWSKNATDCFSAIAIYTYIVSLPVPLPSWIEWTIKCVKGWGFHMKFL